MHRCLPACVLALLGVALLALSGCASSPPTRLYVVPSLTDTATAPPLAPHAEFASRESRAVRRSADVRHEV